MSFIVEKMEDGSNRFIVKNTEKGWFIPADTEQEAEFIKDRFVEVTTVNHQSNTIEDYFREWEIAIIELKEKETEKINLKETYNQLEQEIIDNTDFKELYGANNQKVRDNHVRNELKDLVERKNDLELRISYLIRRIDFIKHLMRMQGILIDNGMIE